MLCTSIELEAAFSWQLQAYGNWQQVPPWATTDGSACVCSPCCSCALYHSCADTGATRQLLQGRGQAGIGGRAEAGGGTDNRAFSSVAQHKTPQAPRLTRKNFDRKVPDAGRHLLNLDTGEDTLLSMTWLEC
jgi:hypothetical protein